MVFSIKGYEPLTEKIAVRLTPDEKLRLQEESHVSGLSVSELVRRRYFGRRIVAHADLTMIRELRRLGGLLKHIHQQSDGLYSRETGQALRELKSYLVMLSHDRQKS